MQYHINKNLGLNKFTILPKNMAEKDNPTRLDMNREEVFMFERNMTVVKECWEFFPNEAWGEEKDDTIKLMEAMPYVYWMDLEEIWNNIEDNLKAAFARVVFATIITGDSDLINKTLVAVDIYSEDLKVINPFPDAEGSVVLQMLYHMYEREEDSRFYSIKVSKDGKTYGMYPTQNKLYITLSDSLSSINMHILTQDLDFERVMKLYQEHKEDGRHFAVLKSGICKSVRSVMTLDSLVASGDVEAFVLKER